MGRRANDRQEGVGRAPQHRLAEDEADSQVQAEAVEAEQAFQGAQHRDAKMSDPWVVTYEFVHRGYDERAGIIEVHSTVHFFTGPEAECRRIAAASVAPTSFRQPGEKIVAFRAVVGSLEAWERHLKDWEEACRDE